MQEGTEKIFSNMDTKFSGNFAGIKFNNAIYKQDGQNVTISTQLSGEEGIKTLQAIQEKYPDSDMTKGIPGMIEKLKNKEAVSLTLTGRIGKDGKESISNIKLEQERETETEDMTEAKTGVDKQNIYRNTTTRKIGYDVDPTTMARFASPEATQEEINIIGGDIYTSDGRINTHNAQMEAVAFADIGQKIQQRKGSILSQAVLNAGGKISIEANDEVLGIDVLPFVDPKASAHAGVDLSRYDREVFEYNLDYSFTRQMQEKARRMATINGVFHKDLAAKYYHEGMMKYLQWKDEVAKGKKGLEFGASSIIGEPLMKAIKFAGKRTKEFMDATKRIVDSDTSPPMSQEEKQKRMEELEKLASQYKGQ